MVRWASYTSQTQVQICARTLGGYPDLNPSFARATRSRCAVAGAWAELKSQGRSSLTELSSSDGALTAAIVTNLHPDPRHGDGGAG